MELQSQLQIWAHFFNISSEQFQQLSTRFEILYEIDIALKSAENWWNRASSLADTRGLFH